MTWREVLAIKDRTQQKAALYKMLDEKGMTFWQFMQTEEFLETKRESEQRLKEKYGIDVDNLDPKRWKKK